MWGNKKPDTPPLADPGPKIVQANQSLKPAPASWGRTTKMNKDVMRPTGAAADRATARLGSSLHVKGEISGDEDLHIDGTVEGAVQLGEGKLTVGATANVTADIIAREVVVCGNVKGIVRAKGKIEIKKDGSVIGDLTTAQIIIEDGAAGPADALEVLPAVWITGIQSSDEPRRHDMVYMAPDSCMLEIHSARFNFTLLPQSGRPSIAPSLS